MSIYNLKGSNTRRIRAAMALARNDAGLARIAFEGDSATAGYGTIRGADDPVTKFREQLKRAGFRTGELIHVVSGVAEPRLPATGTWTLQGVGSGFFTAGPGATVSHSGTGRFFEIIGSNQSAPFSYSVDGLTPVAVSTNNLPTYKVVTVDTGTEGPHTLTITCGTGNSYWFSIGNRPATGVVVENAGVSGSMAADHVTPTLGNAIVLSSGTYPDLDAVVVELGMNELRTSYPVDQYKTKLSEIVGRHQASGADVFLTITHTPVPSETIPATAWDPYREAQYQIADEKDVPLLDLGERFGWASTGNDFDAKLYDMSTDGSHLTAVGNSAKALAWTELFEIGFGPLA